MSQQLRRHDPYPWTWEIPAGVVAWVVTSLVCGVHLGRAVANLLAGGGWEMPTRTTLFRSLTGVLGGDAAAGLPGLHGQLASPMALWVWVAVTELVVVAASLVLLKLGLDRWGPGRMKGMATPAQAEQLLGVSRLRRNSTIIRPDLYGNRRSRT